MACSQRALTGEWRCGESAFRTSFRILGILDSACKCTPLVLETGSHSCVIYRSVLLCWIILMSSLKLIFTYVNCLFTQQTGLCAGPGHIHRRSTLTQFEYMEVVLWGFPLSSCRRFQFWRGYHALQDTPPALSDSIKAPCCSSPALI